MSNAPSSRQSSSPRAVCATPRPGTRQTAAPLAARPRPRGARETSDGWCLENPLVSLICRLLLAGTKECHSSYCF